MSQQKLLLLFACTLSVMMAARCQYSNEGTDFCIGYLKKLSSYNAHVLVGSTSSSLVDFTIQYSNNQNSDHSIPQGTDSYIIINMELIMNGNTNKGICFTSTGNNTGTGGLIILPYLSSSPTVGGSGSYLALPYQELVTDQYEYYTLSTSSSSDQYYSGFMLVGLRDNTTITIYPSIPLNTTTDTQSEGYIAVQPDQNHTVVLHRRQTQYIGKDGKADVTGTRIVSDKPLTVISGHEAGSVPSDGTLEPMAQQIPPTQLWGDTFMIAPMMGHSQGQIIKILSSVDYTEISYNCHQFSNNTAVLQKAGSVHQIYVPDNVSCYIQANNSVLVGQFPYSPPGNSDGDTTMILVPSIDQYYNNNVIFWTLNTTNNFIIITVPAEDNNHSNIMYDGGSIPEECWSPIYDNSNNLVGYGCRLGVSKGHHTVSNGNGLLSVLVCGFGIGHAYGYPAALHFTPSKVLGVYFSFDEYTFKETEGNVTIIINRVTHLKSTDHYHFNITADSSINSGRLTLVSQNVVFPPMESSVSAPIIINDNDITEGNEYYTVQLCRDTDPLRDVCIQAGIRILDDDAATVIGITECGVDSIGPGIITWSLTIGLTNGTLPTGVNCNITTDLSAGGLVISKSTNVTQCPSNSNTSSSSVVQYLSIDDNHGNVTVTSKLSLINNTNIIVINPDTCQQNIIYNSSTFTTTSNIITSTSSTLSSATITSTSLLTLNTSPSRPSSSMTTSITTSIATYSTVFVSTSSSNPIVSSTPVPISTATSPEVMSSTITTSFLSVAPVVTGSSHTVAITLGTVLPLLTLITVIAVIIAVYAWYRMRKMPRSFSVNSPEEDSSQQDSDPRARLITMISNPRQLLDESYI